MCDLFDKNMNLVPHVFNCYFKYRHDIEEDLLQEGYTELWRVANNFDASKGKKFSTYAITCIRGKMSWYINTHRNMVKPPEELIKLAIKIVKDYGSIDNAPKDISEIVTKYGVSDIIAQGLTTLSGNVYLDAEIKDSKKDTQIVDLYAVSLDNVEDEVEKKVLLEQYLKTLNDKRNEFIFLKVIEGETFTEIASQVNLSYRQVSRIAKKMYQGFLDFQKA